MRLVELRVKNFRGLGGEDNVINFRNNNIIFLIGQNNVGKSSFLHAYDFFTNSKGKATIKDFFKQNISLPIEIEGDFELDEGDEENPDFSSKDPDWISKWVQADTGLITVKKIWSDINKAFSKYTKNPSGDFQLNGFGGMDSLFTKCCPKPIFINAIETVEALEKELNKIIENEQIKKIKTNFPDQYENCINAIKEIQESITGHDTIIEYNQRINSSFQKIFPSLKLKISIKDESAIDVGKAFKQNHSIDVVKEGIERKETFDQHGHGVIRQAFFNYLTFLNNNSSGSTKDYLLLFEEPELFLHPKSTRMLRQELYNLAENSPFQILCCTHCPQMIDISKPHCSLVRVEKITASEFTQTYQVGHDLFQNDENKDFIQMVNRFDPNVCECFYSSHVVIVEGDTEAIVCREILNSCYDTHDVFVLNSGSKNNIPFFQRVFNHFNIAYTVIHDSDYRYQYSSGTQVLKEDGSPKNNSAWTLNQKIWDEIENGKTQGINVHRLVSVHDFESSNGYIYNKTDGKPLSAYKFACQDTLADSSIFKFIEQIVNNEYEQEWTPAEFNSIPEPY